MTDPWYKCGLRFRCSQCGNCCSGSPGYVWVDSEEIAQIADFIERQEGAFPPYLRKIGDRYSLLEKANNDCIFLERTSTGKTLCQIHPVKPKQCRTWPFWDTILQNEEIWRETRDICPGIGEGKLYSVEEIERIQKGDDSAV